MSISVSVTISSFYILEMDLICQVDLGLGIKFCPRIGIGYNTHGNLGFAFSMTQILVKLYDKNKKLSPVC